jgi:hypothetical protein
VFHARNLRAKDLERDLGHGHHPLGEEDRFLEEEGREEVADLVSVDHFHFQRRDHGHEMGPETGSRRDCFRLHCRT